ncbi:PHF2 [Cordylochernes scorpioides]|uniref:PHF2 n=1 Tax=Cordylochernes scorpioides TaxID=51811 RepID=A0ABY6KLE4_9ARAC|nr:PHF2 [Cordylochernes scorpioides]
MEKCINVKEYDSIDIEKYHCPRCQKIFGKPIRKERKNYHRHDYSDPDAVGKNAFVIKTGTTTQWQANLAPKEMAVSDMRNRHHVQPLLTWSTNAAHPVSLDQEPLQDLSISSIGLICGCFQAVQTGTPVFIHELKSRCFSSAEEILVRLRAQLLTLPYLLQSGFDRPIMVENKSGLGMMLPPEDDGFSVLDVMKYLGEDFSFPVIDVTRQNDIRMTMREWVDYFLDPNRSKVYNVISLEFSNTRMGELVKPPDIVNKLCWVANYWPLNAANYTSQTRPNVSKYCLMSTKDSYTDFHIDFGGTSVWYHVLRGEKIFYLIEPTPANVALYERWMSSATQSETFFGDQVASCRKLVLGTGHTLFIPTGWIHAVLTTQDSLVFGGNFLSSLNIPLQLQ